MACCTPRCARYSAIRGPAVDGVMATTGRSGLTRACSASATAGSSGAMTSFSSPGPSVVRSGPLSGLASTISARSARKASSERASRPSSASTISGERESVRLAS
jgi:hypothetical protein